MEKGKTPLLARRLYRAALLFGAGLGAVSVTLGTVGQALGFIGSHADFNLACRAVVVTVKTAARGVAAGYGGVLIHGFSLNPSVFPVCAPLRHVNR